MKRRDPCRLAVEVLEDRTMPAFFSWIGGGSNLWENAADWDQNAVPTLADDVNISVANATVVNQQGAAAAHSILTDSSVHLVINDSLTLDAGGSIFGQLSVAGSLSLGSGLSYLSVGSLDLTGQVHLGAGAELALLPGASTLHTGAIIDGDGLVTNYGAVAMDGDATVNNLDHAGTLVGPGVLTITGTMNW
ncbi:MAG: hypothetical protein HYR84_02090, partial [Planctomycetes bacterium]|nr:hypothetical protein [Planctomycetota bacterium]